MKIADGESKVGRKRDAALDVLVRRLNRKSGPSVISVLTRDLSSSPRLSRDMILFSASADGARKSGNPKEIRNFESNVGLWKRSVLG